MPTPVPAASFTVGVTVSGLKGSGLQLKNASEVLPIVANGAVTFATRSQSGTAYSTTVVTQPTIPAQTCTVTNGTGTIGDANVTGITVDCVTSTAARFAYSLNYDGQSISAYNLDTSSGQLRIRSYAKTGKGPGETAYERAGKFVFVFNSGIAPSDGAGVPIPPASISVFAHDNVNGDLREVDGSPFATTQIPAAATSMTLHASGKFIYVANGAGGADISQFSVGQNGRLTQIPGGPAASGADPSRVVFDPIGRFAYVTNGRSNDLYVYEINAATGALEERPALRTRIGGRSSPLTFDPSGRFAYVVNLEPASLSAFAVNPATGALTAIQGAPYPLPANALPLPLLFHPSGKYAYVHAYGADGTSASIAAFSIDGQTGALAPLAGSPYPAGSAPMRVTLAPSGKFLYVTNRGSAATADVPVGSISAYGIDATNGVLTAVDGGVTPQAAPFFTTIDPSGQYLYSTSVRSDLLYAYRIDDHSGVLTALSQGAVTRTGHQPTSIDVLVSPTVANPPVFASKFAYVADVSSNSVASFAVNAGTGLLTANGSAPSGGNGVRALAASATGRSFYSVQASGNATAYSIDSKSGALTPVEAGTVPTGAPIAVAIDPSNRFAYVLNFAQSTVSPYRIAAATGRLTASGDAVPTVTQPISMVIDPTGRTVYVAGFSRIQAFSIDVETGALGPPAPGDDGVKVLQAVNAVQVVVEPGGKYLYVVSPPDELIEIYPIDPQTGALGTGRTQTTLRQSASLSIDPSGRFLYAANWTVASIAIFNIDQDNGALVPQRLLHTMQDPRYLAADFSGRFLYAALFDNTIATLAIDQASGALTPVGDHIPIGAANLASIVPVGDVE